MTLPLKEDPSLLTIVGHLANYKPNKLIFQWDRHDIQEAFRHYLRRSKYKEDKTMFHIGFPLADHLNHDQVFGFAWQGTEDGHFGFTHFVQALKNQDLPGLSPGILKEIQAFGHLVDQVLDQDTLRDLLVYENTSHMVEKANWYRQQVVHLMGLDPKEAECAWQYRNLNMTSHVLNMVERQDRLLIFCHLDHVKTLAYMLGQSDVIQVVSPLDYL